MSYLIVLMDFIFPSLFVATNITIRSPHWDHLFVRKKRKKQKEALLMGEFE